MAHNARDDARRKNRHVPESIYGADHFWRRLPTRYFQATTALLLLLLIMVVVTAVVTAG